MFEFLFNKKEKSQPIPETVIYTENVYLTPDAKLIVHTIYRGKSQHNPTYGTKCLTTNDDKIATNFLNGCELLGEL